MLDDIKAQGRNFVEVLIARGYLGAPEIEQQRQNDVVIRKVWADGAYHGRAIDEARTRANIEIVKRRTT